MRQGRKLRYPLRYVTIDFSDTPAGVSVGSRRPTRISVYYIKS